MISRSMDRLAEKKCNIRIKRKVEENWFYCKTSCLSLYFQDKELLEFGIETMYVSNTDSELKLLLTISSLWCILTKGREVYICKLIVIFISKL